MYVATIELDLSDLINKKKLHTMKKNNMQSLFLRKLNNDKFQVKIFNKHFTGDFLSLNCINNFIRKVHQHIRTAVQIFNPNIHLVNPLSVKNMLFHKYAAII